MKPDGVYVDAAYADDGSAVIAMVRFADGRIVDRHKEDLVAGSSYEAECAAILRGRLRFPGAVIYSDCLSAARDCNAVWISRKQNREADRLTRATIVRAIKPPKARPFLGQGCRPFAWADTD